MSNVTDIWLFVQTAARSSAGSTADLILKVITGGESGVSLPAAGQKTATNGITTPGTSAQFHWQQGVDWPEGSVTGGNISRFSLTITGPNAADAWMPSAIWVAYRGDTGAYTLGPQNPNWPASDCFSSDPNDCGGKAKATWVLPWTQLDPVVELLRGGLLERQLEPSESAVYELTAVNLSRTVTIDSMVLGLVYDEREFRDRGVTFGVGTGPSGLPEVNVATAIPPGGSTAVNVPVYTNDAEPAEYTFAVKVLSLSAAAADAGASLFVDQPHTFIVVGS